MKDLVPAYIPATPICDEGGVYTLGKRDDAVLCSYHRDLSGRAL